MVDRRGGKSVTDCMVGAGRMRNSYKRSVRKRVWLEDVNDFGDGCVRSTLGGGCSLLLLISRMSILGCISS